jgi:hypothetical protein
LDIEIQGQLNMAMADLIALLVLSRESNLPLKKFTLAAGDSLEIKVRVEARKDARIPSNFGKKYKDFPLGKLHLRSEHVAETILVHGSLEPVTHHYAPRPLAFVLLRSHRFTGFLVRACAGTHLFVVHHPAPLPIRCGRDHQRQRHREPGSLLS